MRRSIAAVVVAMSAALSVVPTGAATATDGSTTPSGSAAPLAQEQAGQALDRARAVLSGAAGATTDSRVEGTLAMRDLFAAYPALTTTQRTEARRVLARPTDGTHDPYGDGYTVPARRKCVGHFCIHWVPTTSDAPPSKAWVDKTLKTMNQVWHKEVGTLHYRRPLKDGHHGGSSKFDVYLKDVGADYLYGYCAPEYVKAGHPREASGYCVLDNDFASSQYGGAKPVNSLRVTAAHEFFHAIQFGYDYKEDPWLMEATSTWMEERFADGINDNRQYLPYGQVRRPATSLDVYNQQGFNQYGNWPFFEYLSSRYGNHIVRAIWNRAGDFPGGGKDYSTQAVVGALRDHGGFKTVFSRYASANTTPAHSYAEGSAWPSAKIDQHWTLSQDTRHASAKLTVNHMAARDSVLQPDASLQGKRWRGRIVVDGPGRAKSPAVYVLITRTNGKTVTKSVQLTRTGYGKISFPFSSGGVKKVTVTVANASTRFDCHRKTSFSCRGKPLDNGNTFQLKVSAFRG